MRAPPAATAPASPLMRRTSSPVAEPPVATTAPPPAPPRPPPPPAAVRIATTSPPPPPPAAAIASWVFALSTVQFPAKFRPCANTPADHTATAAIPNATDERFIACLPEVRTPGEGDRGRTEKYGT